MNKRIKIVALSSIFCSVAFGNICHAKDCKEINADQAVANLAKEHEGSKVLKVEESTDDKGCAELKIRILIDGTVKAITIPNETGA